MNRNLLNTLLVTLVLMLPFAAASAEPAQRERLREMTGSWNVVARVWLAPGTEPLVQQAVAKRRLVGQLLLQEIMTPAGEAEVPGFLRFALLNYNAVTDRFEYTSWDTRAPQMMYQTSDAAADAEDGILRFRLADTFVIPQWGDARNVAFRQRMTFEAGPDRQVVRLYWTGLSAGADEEYLAGEYVYTRATVEARVGE